MRRGAALAAFVLACAALALLTAALGTARWTLARARRVSNPAESDARVTFGLFEGEKRLNPGYGWRDYALSVRAGTLPARKWAWLGAALLTSGALVASGAAALLSALRACAPPNARAPRDAALVAANALLAALGGGGVAVWASEFLVRLQHNVMSDEELANMWSSEGGAELGVSFWLAAAGACCGLVNLLLVGVVAAGAPPSPPPTLHEKHNPAIMLY